MVWGIVTLFCGNYILKLCVSAVVAFGLFHISFYLGIETKSRDAFIHQFIRLYLSDKYFIPYKYSFINPSPSVTWSHVEVPSKEWIQMQDEMFLHITRLTGTSLFILFVM